MTDLPPAIISAAAALVCAVSDHDRDAVAAALTPLTRDDLYAVAVLLAANVAPDAPLRATMDDSPSAIVNHAIDAAAERFATTREAILSTNRHRNVNDARAVAMAACRLAGLSSPLVGRHFRRDHSTVLYAATRVGENRRLRQAANVIAAPYRSDLLGDEDAA